MAVRKNNYLKHFVFTILIILSVVLFYGIFIEPYCLHIRHVTVHDTYLANILGGKTVVQLSDLHIRNIGTRELKLLDMLLDIQPDYIFLTGDYVKWKGDYDEALQFLTKLEAKDGIYAVMGDYDYSNTRQSCLFCHEKESIALTTQHKVHFLRNSSALITTPKGYLWIAGIEWKEKDFLSSLRNLNFPTQNMAKIILCHSPFVFDYFDEVDNLFILSGDTHGGQIPILLPKWFLDILGYKKNTVYNRGLFERDTKKMFVSCGIGTSHIPIRVLRKPEIVVLHFTQ